MTCTYFDDLLAETRLRDLSAALTAEHVAHLESCASCRQRVSEALALAERFEGWSVDAEPQRDLWPAIETEIVREQASPWPLTSQRVQTWALAASLLMLLATGVLFVGTLSWSSKGGGSATAVLAPSSTVTPTSSAASGETLGPNDFDRIRSELERALAERRDEVPAEALARIEVSLQSLDTAVAEIRAAAGTSPEPANLTMKLAAHYQREVDLLERISRW